MKVFSRNAAWIFLALCCLFFSACPARQETKTVQPVNEPEFLALLRNLQPMMKANQVVDQEGAWYSPMLSRGAKGTEQAGKLLLDRLSPAFRFPDMAPARLPGNFRMMFTPEVRISIDEYSFTALQGSDRIYVSLLAVLDWNQDEKDDWLVLCRITPTALPGSSRDYYLLLSDLEQPVLMPRVLAIRDCRNNICEVFDSAGTSPLFQDINSLDLMPGEASVTAPPEPGRDPVPAQEKDGLRESRLEN